MRSALPSRHRAALATVLAVALLLVAAPGAFAFFTPESGGSPNADRIDTLYKVVLVVAAIVFFGVEGALFYSLFKFRARKGAVAAQIRGNTRLEIAWTAGAAVILVVLAVITFIALPGIRNPENSDAAGFKTSVVPASYGGRVPPDHHALLICVNGQQYIWRFTYPTAGGSCQGATGNDPEALRNDPFAYQHMYVPAGTTVVLSIQAQDVAHSWWVPALGGKFDAIPGYTNRTWFKIPMKDAGHTFTGQCAELCGRNHANMTAQVTALTPGGFGHWLAQRKADIAAADKAAQQTRPQVNKQLDQTPQLNKQP